ncbi:MAG: glucose-1-phosphate cytidylyltransferase [Geminicoccaceae bacterium]
MRVAILAGGLGSRLSEATARRSKAMVEIGDRPILWHIMRYYAHFGFDEFVIALGHHGETIREHFAQEGFRRIAPNGRWPNDPAHQLWHDEAWRVHLVDTGLPTENGGRIKRLAPYLRDGTFMLTWCDGLADVDLDRLLAFHRAHRRLATLTAIHPPGRFGRLALDGDRIAEFQEKTIDPDEWINGAFFVLEPEVLDYIAGDETRFELEPLARLAHEGQLMAYRHESFWQCMDTIKEARALNSLWASGSAPWKIWSS